MIDFEWKKIKRGCRGKAPAGGIFRKSGNEIDAI
jgi:hypothetical protein